MSRSPRHQGRKRRQKTQASQGDAVLINFLGGQNHPDVATRAGEEPLNSASQSETGDMGEEMESDAGNVNEKNHLVQTAQDALSVDDQDDRGGNATYENVKRVRPKLQTSLASSSREQNAVKRNSSPFLRGKPDQDVPMKNESLEQPTSGSHEATDHQHSGASLASRRRSLTENRDSSPIATSARLRHLMTSQGSETLPAIQSTTPSTASKSPNSQQNLPSISAQLGPLVDKPSPSDATSGRTTYSVGNGMHSPPSSGISPLPNHYPSPQSRLNSHFVNPYAQSQPSPASVYSEASPREPPYRTNQDPTSMSPPGKPGQYPYYGSSSGRAPQSEELTPLSADSYPGSKPFAISGPPTTGDHVMIEPGRPILPPLPTTGPLASGHFKCDYQGCTASPFQTQYLLK
ncbi:MAG: hypothetical protein Q9190_006914 [Brigantiaea leucoxantha]